MLFKCVAHTVLFVWADNDASKAARAVARVTCPECAKSCVNAGAVAAHVLHAHPGYVWDMGSIPPITKTRSPYTTRQKANAIEHFNKLERAGHPTPAKQTVIDLWGAKNYLQRKGQFSNWQKKIQSFHKQALATPGGRYRVGAVRKADYPDEEDELYVRLLVRRVVHGFPCNHYWLQSEFKLVLMESMPAGYLTVEYSWGWSVRFCHRYRLSTQAKNNIKAHDQVDRGLRIRAFHRYWLDVVQKSEPQTDAKYGRFAPDHIFHIDQVPLPFASGCRNTLNPIGSRSCRISGPNTAGLEKRQATLQMWICADGAKQVIKPTIIFRGKVSARSKLPWAEEAAVYATLPNIRVAFQPCAWADEDFCTKDILNVASDLEAAGVQGEVVIGMDNHSSQRTAAIRDLYESLGMFALYTPADCTDCVSPVDHHVGNFIQEHMAKAYQKEINDHPEVWIAESAEQAIEDVESSSAMNRRICMARWLSAAWADLASKGAYKIHQAFFNTGFLLAMDGSEDDQMRLQGWASLMAYKFRD
jgi:hypothetical protein